MTDKVQKIRKRVVEIVNSINPFIPDEDGKNSDYEAGKLDAATQILQIIDSLEDPVSGLDNGDMQIDRWRQAVEAASNQKNYRSSKGFTETRDDYFFDGVQWADEHPKEEPISEELEEAADCYKDMVTPEDVDDYEHAYFYETYTEYQIADAFKAGANWKIAKLMKDAIDVTVHIEAGNYPYIPQMELYDYDKDVPLAKEGDKYKVILIKEE